MKFFFNEKPLKDFPLGDKVLSLIKKYKNPKNSLVLEVGCGDGRFASYFGKKFKRYYGIDPDKEYISIAKEKNKSKNFIFKKGYAEKIPFKGKFDIIFLPLSWHFIDDFDEALLEIKRVIKDEGIIIIVEPPEKTKIWASPVLTKGTPEFNKDALKQKITALKKAKGFLHKQNILKIVKKELGNVNLWILKVK